MSKLKSNVIVATRQVTIYRKGTINQIGGGKSKKEPWRLWNEKTETIDNIADAINHISKRMLSSRIGGIVAIFGSSGNKAVGDYTKIFQAKWGTDNIPFVQFDGVAGHFWYRKLLDEVKK